VLPSDELQSNMMRIMQLCRGTPPGLCSSFSIQSKQIPDEPYFDGATYVQSVLKVYIQMKANFKRIVEHIIPISYTIFLIGFFLFTSSKFLSNFYYLGVAFPFFLLIVLKEINPKVFFSSRTILFVTIYFMYMFCTLFWAESFGLSDLSKYGRRALYILMFIAVTIYLTQSNPHFLKRLLTYVCSAAILVGIGNALFYYSKHPVLGTLWGYGLLSSPSRAASQYGFVTIASIYLLLQQRTTKAQFLYAGMVLVNLSYVLLAQSRTTLIALVITIFTWQLSAWLFYRGDENNHLKKLFVLLVLLSAGISALIIGFPEFSKAIFHKQGFLYRIEMWKQLLAQIANAPWFGHGLNAEIRLVMPNGFVFIHPHSVYMGTLFYGGITGLLILLATLFSALWQGFKPLGQHRNLALASMILYGALAIVSNGNMLIHHPKPFWLFLWFPVALVAATELSDDLSSVHPETPFPLPWREGIKGRGIS
jgi:O-antigen ligase